MPYHCARCGTHNAHWIRVTYDGGRQEECSECSDRSAPVVPDGLIGFRPGYNPGLGEHIDSHRKQREICKRKGFVEVGNG